MRKYFLFLFALCLMPCFGIAQTIISTNITSNTTWIAANSPYRVINTISIASGASLTIQPGVEVQLDSVTIDVFGSLNMVGTATDSILITTSNPGATTGYNFDWNWLGISVNGGQLSCAYTIFTQGATAIQFGANSTVVGAIEHCTFVETYRGMRTLNGFPDTLRVENCHFLRTPFPLSGNELSVEDCYFEMMETGINATDSRIAGCTFVDNQFASISLNGGEITQSSFSYNAPSSPANVAIQLNLTNGNSAIITENDIQTQFGIEVNGDPVPGLNISQNQICTDSFAVGLTTTLPIDLTNNCWCTWDSASIAYVIVGNGGVTAPNGNFQPVDSSCVPSNVFPGDANHDQIANNNDLLPIGLFFGDTGPVRPNASLTWIPQAAPAWGDSLLNTTTDLKHVDTNGDGSINDDDTLAITLNYGLTHNEPRPTGEAKTGIPLLFEMPATVNQGDTLAIPVLWGTVDTPAVNVYGLAFSVDYDSSLIVPGSIRISYETSWLGNKGSDLLTLGLDLPDAQQLDAALVRNDQVGRSGMGQIAEVIVVIDDDIFKREQPFTLSFSNITAIDPSAGLVEVAGEPGTTIIEEVDTSTTSIADRFSLPLLVAPNPASDQLMVRLPEQPIHEITLFNLQGQLVRQIDLAGSSQHDLNVGQLPRGMYLLQVRSGEQLGRSKVLLH
ncbi:MAG: T9SS type A sorting domain-containing protein [Bacteroidota bacterium]